MRGRKLYLLLSCAGWAGCVTASALAADLSVSRAPFYAPFSWSGLAGREWAGSARARLGYAWNRTMIYATGGFSYALVRLTDGAFFNGFATQPAGGSVAFNYTGGPQDSVLKGGWAAGGGVDYAYTNN